MHHFIKIVNLEYFFFPLTIQKRYRTYPKLLWHPDGADEAIKKNFIYNFFL